MTRTVESRGQPADSIGLRASRQPAKGFRMWTAPATIMLATLLSYIDRNTLAALSVMILADTNMSAESYSWTISAFSIAYMIGNPLWGSVLDHVGLRAGMLVAVTLWTAASTAHAWVAGFVGFAVARAVLGFGEGAAFPGALRTAAESLPEDRQSRGMALGYSGASLGAIITPPLMNRVALAYGWRTAFLVTGLFGAVWLLVWAMVARPPFLPKHARRSGKIVWPNLADRRCWVIASSFGLGAVALGIVGYLTPLYLNRALGLTQAQLGDVLWIPLVGWEAGYFFWGWMADRYAADMPDRERPKRLFIVLTLLALPVGLITQTDSLALTLMLLFWATFVADGFVVTSLRVGTRIYPREQTAMVAGIGSASWSAVQAVVLPLYGRWVDQAWFTGIFVTMSLLPLAGTGLWLLLSRDLALWRREQVMR